MGRTNTDTVRHWHGSFKLGVKRSTLFQCGYQDIIMITRTSAPDDDFFLAISRIT